MAENLIINGENKRELYETLLPQLQSLTAGETDVVANMANVAAALKQTCLLYTSPSPRDEQ